MNTSMYSRRALGAAAVGAGAGAFALAASPSPALAQTAPSPWWVNVKDHGAVGDGTTDDTAAIQAAIDAARAAGGGIVILPAGTYKVTSTLYLTDPAGSTFPAVSLQGVGQGASIIQQTPAFSYAKAAVVFAGGRDGDKRALGAAVAAGTRTLSVPSALADELSVGNIIGIEASGPVVFGGATASPRELHRVCTVSGTTVTIDSPLVFDYDSSVEAWRAYGPEGVTISDLSFTCEDPFADFAGAYSLRFIKAGNVAIERVIVTNAGGGINLKDVVDAHVTDVTVGPLPLVAEPPWGYGLVAAGCTANLIVKGLVGRWCRCVFTTLSGDFVDGVHWGGPRDITIVGGIGEGGPGSATIWSTHEFGVNIAFIGCTARGADVQDGWTCPGFHARAWNVSFIDCVAVRCAGDGVHINTQSSGTTVQGGEFAYNGGAGIGANGSYSRVVGAHVHDNAKQGIGLYNETPGPINAHIIGCHIHDNGMVSNGYGIHDNSSGSTTLVVSGNVIPKSATQTLSMLSFGAKWADTSGIAISNNVLLGYGSGKMGYYPANMAGIKSFNTTDP